MNWIQHKTHYAGPFGPSDRSGGFSLSDGQLSAIERPSNSSEEGVCRERLGEEVGVMQHRALEWLGVP